MNYPHSPLANQLIAAFPSETKNRLLPSLRLIELPLGKVLSEANSKDSVVLFPTNAIISLAYVTQNGASGQISVVGNEGMVGVSVLLCSDSTSSQSIVVNGGYAYRLPHQCLRDEFNRSGEFQTLMLRYAQVLMTQIAQTAVCNRHHSTNQRLCRWLLESLDRLQGTQLKMTHELIASMLGVRRESISEAAGRLHKLGVIEYRRGHITVLDRAKLEELCCECYFAIKKETMRLQITAKPEKQLDKTSAYQNTMNRNAPDRDRFANTR